MKNKISKKRKDLGFTLIEVIVVVAIIGVLSSIAITKYGSAQESAKLNADYVSAANIATAANIAFSEGKISNSETIRPDQIKDYLGTVPKPQSTNGEFSIAITNGDVVVDLGGKTFYPKPSSNDSSN